MKWLDTVIRDWWENYPYACMALLLVGLLASTLIIGVLAGSSPFCRRV